MPFDRYSLFLDATLAWRLFKRHHTQFNVMFWSHKAAKAHAFSSTTSSVTQDATGTLFRYAAGNRRVPATLGKWAESYSDFDRWTQLASTVAIAGYLETYIAQVATAALESNPSIVLGGGPRIEGATYLKRSLPYDLYSHTKSLVHGDWCARTSAYQRLFGTCPFAHLSGALEALRTTRNDAGHCFGRDIKAMSFAPQLLGQRLPRVSDRAIQRHLKTIADVTITIERQLGPVIGQYEIIKVLHRWLSKRTGPPATSAKVLARQFSTHVYSVTGNTYGAIPAAELIQYYDAL